MPSSSQPAAKSLLPPLPTLAAALAYSAAVTVAAPRPLTRVVNGNDAEKGAYPWVVALDTVTQGKGKKAGPWSCGGMLIHPSYVMSAAHCFWKPKAQGPFGKAYLGSHSACFDEDGDITTNDRQGCDATEIRMLTEMHIHPQYKYSTDKNDIVILKLDTPVDTIDPVPYATEPFSDTDDFGGNSAGLVLGWGVVNEKKDTMAAKLQQGQVELVNTKSCGNDFKYKAWEITSTNICSTSSTNTDACSGDSGGPLFHPATGKVVGITSWGQVCGAEKHPGVYTEVGEYAAWIAGIIGSQAPAEGPTSSQKTCDSFTCKPTSRFEHVADASTMVCKKGSKNKCTKNQCCAKVQRYCSSVKCKGKFQDAEGASSKMCSGKGQPKCNRAKCCERN